MDATVLARENALLKARLAEVEAALAESQEANRRLEDILRTSQRAQFGKRSEKLSPDQFNLPLEDAELAQGVLEAAQEKAEAALQRARGEAPRKPKRNRGHLPAHLPRVERVVEPASTRCPCGCGEMAKIGEDVSERLDVIPAQFRVLVTRRPKYACRRCSQAMAQAHAPEHVVPGGLPTELFIACRAHRAGSSCPSSATICRSTARPRSSSGRGSSSTAARSATGSAGPVFPPDADHQSHESHEGPSARRGPHLRALEARLRRDETRAPVLDPGARPPRAASSGPSCPTTAAMAGLARPSCCSTTPPVAERSIR